MTALCIVLTLWGLLATLLALQVVRIALEVFAENTRLRREARRRGATRFTPSDN